MEHVDEHGVRRALLDMETEIRHLARVPQGLECLLCAQDAGLGKTHDVRVRAKDLMSIVGMIAALAERVEQGFDAAWEAAQE